MLHALPYRAAISCIASLSRLTDLNLESWALSDEAAKALGSGALPNLARLSLGSTYAMSREGYAAMATLTKLSSLTFHGARGDNEDVAPLTALTGLTGLRVELSEAFHGRDAGPLARLPLLRNLGW